MKPTTIKRVFQKRIKSSVTDVYETDTGAWKSEELAKLIGISIDALHSRVRKYGKTNDKILMPKHMLGKRYRQVGNEEYFALSADERVDPETIKVGEFERDMPDPFDEEKVARFDRMRERMSV